MKKMFLYISIGIILLGIPLTVILVGKNQEIRKRAAPASTLSFYPMTQTVKAGQPFTLEVKMDTATNQVGIVQLRVVYDPVFLEAEDITNNPNFAPTIRVSKKIDPSGKASITVGAKDTLHPIVGSGTIVTLSMKAIKASATPISIKFTNTPDTVANAIGENADDVIIGRSVANVIIQNADGTAPSGSNAANINQTANPSGTITPTPTITPSLTPTPLASSSAQASESAVLITSLTNNEEVNTQTPVIRGKGIPGTTLTVTIHSSGAQTVVVTVDANGNWTYTPTNPLDSGSHTVTALYTDPATGVTQSKTTTFVVAPSGIGGPSSTASAMPVSGSVSTTILLITVGLLFIVSGIFIPAVLP